MKLLRCTADTPFWSVSVDRELSSNMYLSMKPSLMLVDSHPSDLPAHFQLKDNNVVKSRTFDEMIHMQVGQVISTHGKYVDEISLRFFQGIHRWLPVISRQRFQDRLISFRGPPTAEFSLLLLSMCLITSQPSADSRGTIKDQENLYLTTKMLFAHVQTVLPTSTSLAQALLLIANYEYGHGLNDAAYVSIGICARMGFAVGLHKTMLNRNSREDETWLQREEERNLWWGILLSERFIASETDKPLATQLPSIDRDLPSDIDLADRSSVTKAETIEHQPVYAFDSETVGSFGREVQATYLYAKVLEAMEIEDPVAKQVEQLHMDSSLQAFFTSIISQCGSTWGLYCGSIALSIGALFTLHGYVLSHSSETQETEALHRSSTAALCTLVKMVVDIARSFNENIHTLDIEILPPRTWNFVRTARYLLDTSGEIRSRECCADVDEIRMMMRHLSQRWKLVGEQLEALEADYFGR
ncbi:hypothetical protein MMC13_008333 [Lambiella insularis]|nr:hypothetical protein [Lambiella insularis]